MYERISIFKNIEQTFSILPSGVASQHFIYCTLAMVRVEHVIQVELLAFLLLLRITALLFWKKKLRESGGDEEEGSLHQKFRRSEAIYGCHTKEMTLLLASFSIIQFIGQSIG